MSRCLPPLFAVALLVPCVHAQGLLSPDPLDRVEPYTLAISADGRANDDYLYLGFVHGNPPQAVHLGFTSRQSTSRSINFFRGGEFPAPHVPRDPHGMHYYSLAWAADSLAQAINFAKNRAAKNLSLSPADARLVALPEAITAEGKSYTHRARLNLFDPTTRSLLLDYVRAHVKAWSAEEQHRAAGAIVRYWGFDNEWEGHPDYSPEARAAFADWLQKAYKNNLAHLNEAWTTGVKLDRPFSRTHPFGSFDAAAHASLPAPADYAKRPGAYLDWMTFQSEHFVTFLAELGHAMRDADPLQRGVVHKSTQQTLEMPGVNRTHTFNHELFAELFRPISGGLIATDMYGAGDRQAYELNFLYNSIRPLDRSPGYGVFLPETNNHGGPGHAFAATTWRMLANGLKAADFFTLGFAGAKGDWGLFGFIDPATGDPKDKLFYAGRWAAELHRAASFWKHSVPAAGLPRVAMLMPRRDILLSDRSQRTASRWGYPRNHRWLVYRWLREQGYWVDVIPSTKLDAGYLRDYQALLLVGAEHLADAEIDAVSTYVQSGGVLLSDAKAGYYDEHHRPRPDRIVPLLGLNITEGPASSTSNAENRAMFDTGLGQFILADGHIEAAAAGARPVFQDQSSAPIVWRNDVGDGHVVHLGFELGSSVFKKPAEAMAAFLLDGPTADTEEYARQDGELTIGLWLGGLLREVGVAPAYSASPVLAETGNLRVEQPFTDSAGNLAVVVATRADTEKRPLPPGEITLPLPGGPWRSALWAPAEDNSLVPLEVVPADGDLHRVSLPAIPTAGILYLIREYRPLLSIAPIRSARVAADGHTPRLAPGKPFAVTVELLNPSASPLHAGSLGLQALQGWTVSPAGQGTPELAPGDRRAFEFVVTPPSDAALLPPQAIHPLVATHADSAGARRAVLTTHVQIEVPASEALYLLSDNQHVPATHPFRLATGATYSYEGGSAQTAAISDPAKPEKNTPPCTALTNGFNNRLGWRTTGHAPSGYSAAYRTDIVAPIFDLQSPHQVRRIVINAGPGDLMPSDVAVFTSDDARSWTRRIVDTLPADNPILREYTLLLPATTPKARHVKIAIRWPAPGGTLDEIEIWGR